MARLGPQAEPHLDPALLADQASETGLVMELAAHGAAAFAHGRSVAESIKYRASSTTHSGMPRVLRSCL